jgi:hypothetical protein
MLDLDCIALTTPALAAARPAGGKFVARAASYSAHAHLGLDLLGSKIIWR